MAEPSDQEASAELGGLQGKLRSGLDWFTGQSENTRIALIVGASILGPIALIAVYSFLSDHLVAILITFGTMGLLSSLGGLLFYLRLRRKAAAEERLQDGTDPEEIEILNPPPSPARIEAYAAPKPPKRASPFHRSFTWAALITMLLYLFLCWPVGVIANLMWLSEADGIYHKTGVSPPGRGCLKLLGIVFVLLPFVAFVLGALVGYLRAKGLDVGIPKE